ncbi:MAG: biopolymer transporter ExbD [Waddliaceae bacterium]
MNFKTKLKSTSAFVDLTPLVDVVFLLLIFFLITSDILPLKSLNIETPSLNVNSTPLTTQLVVVLDLQHVIYVGSKKAIVDLASLESYLRKEIKKIEDGEATLVLSVDRRVEYGEFLKVFSICQQVSRRLRLVYQNVDD